MKVECITCDRLRNDTTRAESGMGMCSLMPDFHSVSLYFKRECAKYLPAADKTVTARRAWMAKKAGSA